MIDIEKALKFGVTKDVFQGTDKMFALYVIVELVNGRPITKDEKDRAEFMIGHYGLDRIDPTTPLH